MASLGYTHRRLVNMLGAERVARGEMERLIHSHDFAAIPKPAYLNFQLVPDFVVLPKTAEEVCRLVELSKETGLPLVPRGGGTGFCGGGVANRGGILVDFRQMRKVSKADPATRTITAEAGATWKDVHDAAWRSGAYVPYVPNFALSSTVGGLLNSGGVGVGAYKYGSVRENLVSAEVVLPDGSLLRTGPEKLDVGTAFANLGPLFVGAEGTLGLTTRATLRVYPKPEEIRPLAYSFPSLGEAKEAVGRLVESDLVPFHVSLMDEHHMLFLKALDGRGPGRVALMSACLDGPKDENADDEKALDAIVAAAGGTKLPAADAKGWWDARFYQFPIRRLAGGLVISEAIVPTHRLADCVRGVRRTADRLKIQSALHLSLVDRGSMLVRPYFLADETAVGFPFRLAFIKRFADLALELRGHPLGSGLFLAFNLPRMHGANARKMRYLKRALDPDLRFNPGKTVDMWGKQDLPLLGPARMPPEIVRFGLEALGALRRLGPRDDFTKRRLEEH